jgi:hypothetical protein
MAEKKSAHTGSWVSGLRLQFIPPYRVMPPTWHPGPDTDYAVEVFGRYGALYTIAPAGLASVGFPIEGPYDSVRVYNHPER